jgi:TRAP-type C4-dicarboxylate transport system permease small subunit
VATTDAPEIHTPITSDEIAHTFDDVPVHVNLRKYAIEDWFTLAVFWLMVLCVFLQFFTRYVLNDSLAWTEELAIYALVVVVFMGSSMCVRLSRHIQVDFLYRYLSPRAGRALATLVDVIRIGFFGYAAWLVYKYASLISDERMTTVDLPKSIVFYAVIAAFVLMTVRAIQVAIANLRRGYSVLERPGAFDEVEV